MSTRSLCFFNTDEFGAMREAKAFLRQAGFSVGRYEARRPCGILFGPYDIQTWRNLDRDDRAMLHGVLLCGRTAPSTIKIYDDAPEEAKAAFDRAVEGLRAMTGNAHDA